MNKLLLTIGIVMLPLVAFAFNDKDVRFTVHNLAYNTDATKGLLNTNNERNYSVVNSGATQVCIFCHTPHNASPAVPLWNKVYDPATAATYRLYTSSPTLTTATKQSTLTATSPSVLCLSCHDGKTAMNVLHNSRVSDATTAQNDAVLYFKGGLAGPQSMGDLSFPGLTYTSNLGATRNPDGTILDAYAGNNLTDDHPIGFSYDQAVADDTTGLRPTATAKANQVRFFGPKNSVECSSCHDPHVFYGYVKQGGSRVPIDMSARGSIAAPTGQQLARTPFLVRDNTGSALCLSCHNK